MAVLAAKNDYYEADEFMKKIQDQANQLWAKNRKDAAVEVNSIQRSFIKELNSRMDPSS
jgi:hypothetical protein